MLFYFFSLNLMNKEKDFRLFSGHESFLIENFYMVYGAYVEGRLIVILRVYIKMESLFIWRYERGIVILGII